MRVAQSPGHTFRGARGLLLGFIPLGRTARRAPAHEAAAAAPAALPTKTKPTPTPTLVQCIEVDDADEAEIERCKSAGYSLAMDAAIHHGRRIEQKRWSAIMKSDEAAGRFSLARELACAVDMPTNRVLDILRRSQIERRSRLAESMEGLIPTTLAGRPPRRTGEDAIAASWDRAMSEFAPPELGMNRSRSSAEKS